MLPLCLKETEEHLNFEYQSQYPTIILRLMMLVNSELTQIENLGTTLYSTSHMCYPNTNRASEAQGLLPLTHNQVLAHLSLTLMK